VSKPAERLVISSTDGVELALQEIGLSTEVVREIAIAAASARNDALPVDPSSAAGLLSYIHGVRTVRLSLLPLGGWKVSREKNVESTIHHERGIQVCFQNVYQACGPNDPEAISNKGPAARELVNSGQIGLFDDASSATRDAIGRAPVVWLVCVSVYEGMVQAEVSCPKAFDGGQFDGFSKRIFVMSEQLSNVSRKDNDGDDIVFDVPVTRK